MCIYVEFPCCDKKIKTGFLYYGRKNVLRIGWQRRYKYVGVHIGTHAHAHK